MNAPDSCSFEEYLRTSLYNSKDPRGKQLSTNNKVVKALSLQMNEVNKPNITDAGMFAFKQIMASKDLIQGAKSPVALTASIAKKFLLAGDLIVESDLANCGIAVGILASDIAFVTVTTAATAPATAGFSVYMSYAFNGARILSGMYNAYNSCSTLVNK